MSDIGEDVAVVKEMVEAAEGRLLALNPKHELVAYLLIRDYTERNKVWQEQLRRFSKDPKAEGSVTGVVDTTDALCNYLSALRVAIDESESHKESIAL